MFAKLFLNHRKSLGISLFLFGGPIMYYLRDGIGLAAGSTVFTAVFQGFCLVLMMPSSFSGFKYLHKPNMKAYYYAYWFMSLGVLYLFIYSPNGTAKSLGTALIYDVFIILFFFLLLTVSINELRNGFVWLTMFIALIGCILMIFYALRNPNFVLGQRATIAFTGLDKNNEFNQAGNPHIYSKVAVAGFWAGILLRTHPRLLTRLLSIFTILVTVFTLILTQVMAAYLAVGLSFFVYAYYDRSVIKNIKNWLFGWKGLSLLLVVTIGIIYLYFFTKLGKAIDTYSDFIFSRFDKVTNLITGSSKTYIDPSAKGRLDGISKVTEGFWQGIDGEFWYFLFGHGYEAAYIDSPVFQSFHDLGIIGFLLYTIFLITLWKGAICAIKHPESIATTLIALYFFMTFVYAFTQGMPYGYYAWYYYALYARFLGTKPSLNHKYSI